MSEQETEIATDSTTEAESTVDAVESRPDAVLPVGDTDVTDGEVRSEADVPVVDAVDASRASPRRRRRRHRTRHGRPRRRRRSRC